EMLEYHSSFPPDRIQIAQIVSQFNAADADRSGIMALKVVQTSDQRGFSRTGRTANDDTLSFGHEKIDAAQRMVLTVVFVQAQDFDGIDAHPRLLALTPASRRRE